MSNNPRPDEYSRHCSECRMTLPIYEFKITNSHGREYYSKFCCMCVKKFQRRESRKKVRKNK